MTKSFCIFREDVNAPIFESEIDFTTGCIKNIPKEKFNCKLPDYFYKDFKTPPNFNGKFDKSYYIMALYQTKSLVAFNFYNVGITCLTTQGIVVMLIEDKMLKHYDNTAQYTTNLFNYKKKYIGSYKAVLTQFDIPINFSVLTVDEEGKTLTSTGVIDTGFKDGKTLEEIGKVSSIKAWRDGYDGIILDKDNNLFNYRFINNKLVLGEKEVL